MAAFEFFQGSGERFRGRPRAQLRLGRAVLLPIAPASEIYASRH